jgi:hypothetical protein
MRNFVIGTIFGLLLGTVGLSGIARVVDRGIETFKVQSQELAK